MLPDKYIQSIQNVGIWSWITHQLSSKHSFLTKGTNSSTLRRAQETTDKYLKIFFLQVQGKGHSLNSCSFSTEEFCKPGQLPVVIVTTAALTEHLTVRRTVACCHAPAHHQPGDGRRPVSARGPITDAETRRQRKPSEKAGPRGAPPSKSACGGGRKAFTCRLGTRGGPGGPSVCYVGCANVRPQLMPWGPLGRGWVLPPGLLFTHRLSHAGMSIKLKLS